MNLFRLCGDMLHLLSIVLLVRKIRNSRSCAGISLKTIDLYLIVFVCRYLNLFTDFISLYNTLMKILFISSTAAISYLIRAKYWASYDKEHDTFRIVFLVVPCLLLSFIFIEEMGEEDGWIMFIQEILWSFSLYLEAVAILPQLMLLQRTGEVDMLTADYVAALGGYRFFYLINWIYRYATEPNYWVPHAWIPGIIQTAIYVDFFYYYYKSYKLGKSKITLPQ